MASAVSCKTEVALLGPREISAQLGGADVVVSVEHPVLAEYLPEAYERALLEVLEQRSPRLLLMCNATIGLDLGAALSVHWDAPLVAYASAIDWGAGTVSATAKILGGKVLADVELPGERGIVTVLGGAFSVAAGQRERNPGGGRRRPPGRARHPAHVASSGLRSRRRRRRHRGGGHARIGRPGDRVAGQHGDRGGARRTCSAPRSPARDRLWTPAGCRRRAKSASPA